MNRMGVAALSALLLGASFTSALAADHYAGPIIDTHAHLRTDDSNGLSAAHPIGTAALIAPSSPTASSKAIRSSPTRARAPRRRISEALRSPSTGMGFS